MDSESTRLNVFIARNSNISRRKADQAILDGEVTINDKVVDNPAYRVKDYDIVYFHGNKLKHRHTSITYMFNKPKKVICSNNRQSKTPLVRDFFPELNKVLTAGRLDRDTTGLLIVTNDGQLVNRISHPSNNILKEYVVTTTRDLDHAALKKLASPVKIEETTVTPVKVKKLKPFKSSIVLSEGKKHEVRLIYKKNNLNIIDLKRTRVGGLNLGKLGTGDRKLLTNEQIDQIFGESKL